MAFHSYERRPEIWRDVALETWNDWHWQQQNRVTSVDVLESVIELTEDERAAFQRCSDVFRVAITPHYAALMTASQPLRRQAVPQLAELDRYDFELEDPLAEEAHEPVAGLTNRYPDRALLYVSHNCPMYCRHCTRKRKVADPTTAASRAQIERGLEYIRATTTIRDVIVSGGDPLTLADDRLNAILAELRTIEHIDVIRLGSRNPVTLPQRITTQLCEILRAHRPVFFHTHFNHPDELVPEAAHALRMLHDAGCVLGNQMVLLRGVNDEPETVLTLNRKLLALGCRPYYMLQCDMAEGITHFRTPLSRGLEIMDYLRGRIGGMGIPHFVVDLPGGGSKIELTPSYEVERMPHPLGEEILFRNWKGETYRFIDVDDSIRR